jgi:hypothetical protein
VCILLRCIQFIVSLERVDRDADRNSCEASVIVVSFIVTGKRRQSLVKVRSIKLQGRPFAGSAAVRTDRHTRTLCFFLYRAF